LQPTEEILQNYDIILNEIREYNPELEHKPIVLGLNKIDSLSEEEIAEKQTALEQHSGKKVYALSAAAGMGVDTVLEVLFQQVFHPQEEL
jgi:GTPase